MVLKMERKKGKLVSSGGDIYRMSAASRLLILPRASPITKKAFKVRSSHKKPKKDSRGDTSSSASESPNMPHSFTRESEAQNTNAPGSPGADSCKGSSSDVPMSTSTSSSFRSMYSMRSSDSKTRYARPYAVVHSQYTY